MITEKIYEAIDGEMNIVGWADKSMVIEETRLIYKSGGKSGVYSVWIGCAFNNLEI